MITCSSCQAENQATRFCTNCGAQLPHTAPVTEEVVGQPRTDAETPQGPVCSQCGAPTGDLAFCTSCGARLADGQPPVLAPDAAPSGQYGYLFDPAQAPPHQVIRSTPDVPAPATYAMPPVQPYPGPERRRSGLATFVVVLVVVALAAAGGVGAFILTRDDSGNDKTSATVGLDATPGETVGSGETDTGAGEAVTDDAVTDDADPDSGGGSTDHAGEDSTPSSPSTEATRRVLRLPPGKFCRDLARAGLGYAEAVSYWNVNGRPDRMDADVDGIPCETVYPAGTVRAVWGSRLDTASTNVARLPTGMPCAQLAEYGVEYQYVPDYWAREGYPSYMDRDSNGVPCEIEYSPGDVRSYYGDY